MKRAWICGVDGQDGTYLAKLLLKTDAQQQLPDVLLMNINRASMCASLESRGPVMDHDVVEAAFALARRHSAATLTCLVSALLA